MINIFDQTKAVAFQKPQKRLVLFDLCSIFHRAILTDYLNPKRVALLLFISTSLCGLPAVAVAAEMYVLPSKSFPKDVFIQGKADWTGQDNIPQHYQFSVAQLDGRVVYLKKLTETMSQLRQNGPLEESSYYNEYYLDREREVGVMSRPKDKYPDAKPMIGFSDPSRLLEPLERQLPFFFLTRLNSTLESLVKDMNSNGQIVSVQNGDHVYKTSKANVTVTSDCKDRLIGVRSVALQTGYPALEIRAVYRDEWDNSVPAFFETVVYSLETSGTVLSHTSLKITDYCTSPTEISGKFHHDDLPLRYEFEDERFDPPVRGMWNSSTLPTDEEIFAIAAQNKAKRIANTMQEAKNAAKAAASNDSHNIKDVPVTGESWGKRLRRVPNWVYGGAVVLFLGGWFVAASRRRRK